MKYFDYINIYHARYPKTIKKYLAFLTYPTQHEDARVLRHGGKSNSSVTHYARARMRKDAETAERKRKIARARERERKKGDSSSRHDVRRR